MDATQIFTVFFLLVVGHEVIAIRCPDNFQGFGGRCFAFADSAVTWGDAVAACGVLDATLAQPKTTEINDWIKAQMRTRKFNSMWLGANDMISEKTFHWTDDDYSEVTFTDWLSRQPDNSRGREDCVHMLNSRGTFGWNDAPCSNRYGFICERSELLSNPWF